MKSLAVAVAILGSTLPFAARADDAIAVTATPVASGADPSALFDQQLAAEVGPDQAACAIGGCGSTVVRQQRVDGGVLVQVRRADPKSGLRAPGRGSDDQVLLRRHGRWYAAGTIPLDEEECGAGHCTTQRISSIRARRTGDILWITLRVRTQRAATDPAMCGLGCRPDVSYAESVLAFVPSANPTCARVFPNAVFPDGGGYDSYSAQIVGKNVVMRWRPDNGEPARRVVVHVRA